MSLPNSVICTLIGLLAACGSPPPSPLQEVTPTQVKFVRVVGPDGGSGEIRSRHDVETFLHSLRDLESFRTGKVSPDLAISVILHVGEPVNLRMGPDHIGPNVPASDVVWRWRPCDEAPYQIARAALERGQLMQEEANQARKLLPSLDPPAFAAASGGLHRVQVSSDVESQ